MRTFPCSGHQARHVRMVELVEQMLAAKKQLAGTQSDKDKDFYTNRCDDLDRSPSPAGAGKGGRRPGEGCREQTNFPALVSDLYALKVR